MDVSSLARKEEGARAARVQACVKKLGRGATDLFYDDCKSWATSTGVDNPKVCQWAEKAFDAKAYCAIMVDASDFYWQHKVKEATEK